MPGFRRLLGLVLVSAAAALAVALAPAISGEPSAVTGPVDDPHVYRMSVSLGGGKQWTEWVAPTSGSWVIESEGRRQIWSGDTYAVVDDFSGGYIRTGSPEFLGRLPQMAVSSRALRSYVAGTAAADGVLVSSVAGDVRLRFTRGGRTVSALIKERITGKEARDRSLFAVPDSRVSARAIERPAGARPTLPIRAYWFGNSVAGRDAQTAVEYSRTLAPTQLRGLNPRGEAQTYIVMYERPSAQGKSSAIPGQDAPKGELQVVSQPVGLPASQGALAAFNGVNGTERYAPWPRDRVTVANGESASVIVNRAEPPIGKGDQQRWHDFWVVTDETLVSVIGWATRAEALQLAAALRPIADEE